MSEEEFGFVVIEATKTDKYAREKPYEPILFMLKGKLYKVETKFAKRILQLNGGKLRTDIDPSEITSDGNIYIPQDEDSGWKTPEDETEENTVTLNSEDETEENTVTLNSEDETEDEAENETDLFKGGDEENIPPTSNSKSTKSRYRKK